MIASHGAEALLLLHEDWLLLTELHYLGPLSVRASGPASSLEKSAIFHDPLSSGGGDLIFPEIGLAVSARQGLLAHGICRRRPYPNITLDIDLPDQARALSFAAADTGPAEAALKDFIRRSALRTVDPSTLDRWRSEVSPPPALCKCCAAASKKRARHPHLHPLYRILKHAVSTRLPLHIRHFSPNVQLTADLTPDQIGSQDGWIWIQSGTASLAANLLYVLALAIKSARVDAEDRSCLHAFNSHGTLLFEVSSTPDVSAAWKDLCGPPY